MKTVGKIIAFIFLIIMIGWEIHAPDYEPLGGIVTAIGAIVTLYATDPKEEHNVTMQQHNKGKSTGYQSNRDININTPPK